VGRTGTGTPAREPDESGFVERGGVRVWWESYGAGRPAVLLLPTWSIVHSRHWKAQIPYLARHTRVVTFDKRGCGFSDVPVERAAYADAETIADAAAILDLLGVGEVVAAGLSCGGRHALQLAAAHPDRVRGVFAIGPSVPELTPPNPARTQYSFDDELDTEEGWAKDNRHYRERNYRGFLEFFFGEMFCEPHSTKAIEDCVAWGLDTAPEVLDKTECDVGYRGRDGAEALCRAVRCPVLVVHGNDDRITPWHRGARVAELTGGRLVTVDGGGHGTQARDPVLVNRLLRELVESVDGGPAPASTWTRARVRPRRALFVSSPIGLGHAWRDVRIAEQLRRRVPGLEVHWLAQPPVTAVLEAQGEHIHPASAELASESAHIDAEAGEHRLHAFQAIRRMDEILCANFMLFHDVVRDETYDLWVGDEAWELDRFLHENPELKTAPYAWLTDFVGFLPLPGGGEDEAYLCADENADMMELVERNPRVRDAALFVGDSDDVVGDAFGPGLGAIRPWVERHLRFTGYVPAFDPAAPGDRAALRAAEGWGEDDVVCLVAVGGSGTGGALLRRAVAALPALRARVPGLRMVAVAGPRLDPATLEPAEGLEVRGYVHELHRLAVACDVALVQGGLATTMELVAAGRPFVSVPLEEHFEQQRHVRHRLDRHGARTWLPWPEVTADALAGAVAGALAGGVAYRPVPRDGAARAADVMAELLIR
jgi:pimeloyl-ACP methyl ester carboxylesterase/predicted glycosyltransferase